MKKAVHAAPLKYQRLAPYRGKAGEHLVLAQLLMQRFDAALVAVDAGIDIIASKGRKLFTFQVKSRRVGPTHNSTFSLSKKAIQRKNFPDYLIVVLFCPDDTIDYLIFPRRTVFTLLRKGLIPYRKRTSDYWGAVAKREGVWYLGPLREKRSLGRFVGTYNKIR